MLVDEHRPITVTNADNRILAKCMVASVVDILSDFLLPQQKGFVPGRNGADHIRELNEAFYRAVENNESGFALFLDTHKAFDSIFHDFIITILDHIGLDRWFVNVVRALLFAVRVTPVLGEPTNVWIHILRGVKQGCPLSPLLFIICMDPLLFFLSSIDDICPFAFADDLALYTDHILSFLSALPLYTEFSLASGLKANFEKTYILPTREGSLDHFLAVFPGDWKKIKQKSVVTYLGVPFGHNLDSYKVFEGAVNKFRNRVSECRSVIRRTRFDIRIHTMNIFFLPIIHYLTQFFVLPQLHLKAICEIVRTTIIGFNSFGYLHLIAPQGCLRARPQLIDPGNFNLAALAAQTELNQWDRIDSAPLVEDHRRRPM